MEENSTNNVKFSVKFRAKFIDMLLSSNYAVILKPIGPILFVIVYTILLSLIFISIFSPGSGSILDILFYWTTGIGFSFLLTLILLEMLLLLRVFIRFKYNSYEFSVIFTEDQFECERVGIKSFINYNQIKKIKVMGESIFYVLKDQPQVQFMIIRDGKTRDDIFNFLKGKLTK